MTEYKMPSLGADMESAKLVEWSVKPGDTVASGDVIAEVETDKGVIEIEIFEDGVVDKLLIQPSQDDILVGTPIAIIRGEGEPEPEAAALISDELATIRVPITPLPASEPHPMDQRALIAAPPSNGKRIRVSPIARKVAADLNVDLSRVVGSGPGGAINRADVEAAAKAAAEAPAPKPAPEPVAKPAPKPAPAKKSGAPEAFQEGMRRAIAAAMARSNQDIPHYYLENAHRYDRGLDLARTPEPESLHQGSYPARRADAQSRGARA